MAGGIDLLFDTHALIEIYESTRNKDRILELLNKEKSYISSATVSEITSWAIRSNLDHRSVLENLLAGFQIISLTDEIAIYAGEIHAKYKKEQSDWGMVDSMIYACALSYGLTLVSGDPHFEGKPGTIFIE